MRELLGVEPGAVTAFGVINDTARRVNVVLDAGLMENAILNCHPLVNTMTTSIAARRSGEILRGDRPHAADRAGRRTARRIAAGPYGTIAFRAALTHLCGRIFEGSGALAAESPRNRTQCCRISPGRHRHGRRPHQGHHHPGVREGRDRGIASASRCWSISGPSGAGRASSSPRCWRRPSRPPRARSSWSRWTSTSIRPFRARWASSRSRR